MLLTKPVCTDKLLCLWRKIILQEIVSGLTAAVLISSQYYLQISKHESMQRVCYREFTEQWPKTILVCWQPQARFGSASLNLILMGIIHPAQLVTTMIYRKQNNNSVLASKTLNAFYKYQLHLSYIKSSKSPREEPGMEDSCACLFLRSKFGFWSSSEGMTVSNQRKR